MYSFDTFPELAKDQMILVEYWEWGTGHFHSIQIRINLIDNIIKDYKVYYSKTLVSRPQDIKINNIRVKRGDEIFHLVRSGDFQVDDIKYGVLDGSMMGLTIYMSSKEKEFFWRDSIEISKDLIKLIEHMKKSIKW